ncbi:MAG TPA: hypothetical protein VM939_12245, partial [Gemmatimonadaceae bacterium]|nr:hypothetical protein [Gemmatimonadaceae bacterium]
SAGNPSNEYQGDFCGVYGVMETQGPGGQTAAVFNTDPDINWRSTMLSACGAARKFAFFLGGAAAAPTMLGPQSVVDTLGVLAVGQTSLRTAKFGVQMTNCPGLRFGSYPASNPARVTRLADVVLAGGGTARQWLVESQGSHRAACGSQTKSGGFATTGISYYLPFAMTITEVRAPAPVFP